MSDDPTVSGGWLKFRDPDHTGWVWLPISEIKTMQTADGCLDVHMALPSDAEAAEGAPHDCSLMWWRIKCDDPQHIATQIAGWRYR